MHIYLLSTGLLNNSTWRELLLQLQVQPIPALITSLRKEDKVEWAKRYLSQETVMKKLQPKSVKSSQYSELEMKLFSGSQYCCVVMQLATTK